MTNRKPVPTLAEVSAIIGRAFPQRRVSHFEALVGGLINTNLKVTLDSRQAVVLRLYRDGANVCRKEIELHKLIRNSVPVPEVIHGEPDGIDGGPSLVLLEFVEGLTYQELKRTNNLNAIQEAAASVGETLAEIGKYQFPAAGELLVTDRAIRVGSPYIGGPHPLASLTDRFLDSPTFERRAGAILTNRIHDFMWSMEAQLPDLLDARTLVHGDFGNRNILMHQDRGRWRVSAVVDWEFAFAGSHLLDVGNFLRYERFEAPLREPHFSNAFTAHGGRLPLNWHHTARVIDLTALVECLTHEDLPAEFEKELLNLIGATLDDETRT